MADSPYTPPSFVPSSEDCIMPVVIEEKGRALASGTLYRSRDIGATLWVQAEWLYYTNGAYQVTTDVDDITVTSISGNLPIVRLTFYDDTGLIVLSTTEATQYYLIVTEVDLETSVSTSTTEPFSGASSLRSQINGDSTGTTGEAIHMPTTDVDTGWNASTDDTDVVNYFSQTQLTLSQINGTTIIADVADPAVIRTGPTLTLAYFDSSEKGNNTGTFVSGAGQAMYNYDTDEWDPR